MMHASRPIPRTLHAFAAAFAIVASLAILCAPRAANAADRRTVALGEVSIADVRAHVDARDVREIAESAIDRAAWPNDLKHPILVSVSVVSVERMPAGEGGASSLTCLVSATLRDKKTGNVYAIVESRARKEQKTVTAADERATVSVALENAIGRLPSVARSQ
jgi:hypothetical protein